jgi:hypothetical protein
MEEIFYIFDPESKLFQAQSNILGHYCLYLDQIFFMFLAILEALNKTQSMNKTVQDVDSRFNRFLMEIECFHGKVKLFVINNCLAFSKTI